MNNRDIFGFEYDYIWQNEHYLLLRAQTAITASDLSGLDIAMLSHNDIPGLAPATAEQHNMQCRLLYRITGKRPLHVWLKSHAPQFSARCRLLYRIVSVVQSMPEYMLNEHRLLLDEQVIYVGDGPDEVYLVYVPLNRGDLLPSAQQSIARLTGILLNETEHEAEIALRQVLCDGNKSINEAKRLLTDALKQPIDPVKATAKKPLIDGEMFVERFAAVENFHKPDASETANGRWPLPLICGLLAVMGWLAWASERGERLLLFAVALSLLTAAAFIRYLNQGRLLRSPIIHSPFQSQAKFDASGPLFEQSAASSEAESADSYYDSLPQHTTVLGQRRDATDLLAEADADEMKPLLEWDADGRLATKPISGDRFIIGRNEESDLQPASEGVSRTHAEIELGETLIDLGSKNGTFLNGERLIPFKRYTLNSGDRIRIVRMEYVYKKFPAL